MSIQEQELKLTTFTEEQLLGLCVWSFTMNIGALDHRFTDESITTSSKTEEVETKHSLLFQNYIAAIAKIPGYERVTSVFFPSISEDEEPRVITSDGKSLKLSDYQAQAHQGEMLIMDQAGMMLAFLARANEDSSFPWVAAQAYLQVGFSNS